MRLESIHLKNFGPYADETLDLRQVLSATVSGPNGGGKSTLISDSVLWCLFGQCRADTDAFIRLGETDMSATVIFTASGQRYRVMRAKSIRTKRGKSEHQVNVQNGEEWRPVERSVETILNAGYDVVTASNFIMQDDPFDLCKAKPAQRIGLLSDILNISKYTDDAKLATRQGNLAEGRLGPLVGQVEEKRQAVARHQQAVTALEATEKELLTLNADLVKAQAAVEAGVKQVAGLEATLAAMPAEETGHLEIQVAMLTTTKDRLEQKIIELKGLAERAEVLRASQSEWSTIQVTESVLIEERQIRREMVELTEASVTAAQQDIDGLNTQAADIQQQRSGVALELAGLKSRLTESEQWADQYQRETENIKGNITKAQTQIGLLQTVPCGEDLQRKCGFTKAASETKDKALPLLREERAKRAESRADILALAPQSRTELEASIASLKAKDADLFLQIGALSESFQSVALEDKVKAKQMTAASLKELEDRIQKLEQHRATIQAQLADLPKVQHAIESLPEVQQDLETKVAELAKAQQALTHAKTHAERKAGIERELFDASCSHELAKNDLAMLNTLMQASTTKQAEAKATMTQTAEAAVALDDIEAQVCVLKALVQEYGWLAEAYKRVPVLMIDNAIPIVERAANEALQHLSAEGMTLRFETQKALKTVDKVVDELNIIVRDNRGERPYETYSGGERGLANFATRLGLAALTSTRSGARIETMVVDEAFANLDEAVSERVRAFIGTLPEKFPLVLVITHDANFKGTLGSQIVVTPSAQGSTVAVLG